MRDPKSAVPPYIPARPFVVDPPATELAWWLGARDRACEEHAYFVGDRDPDHDAHALFISDGDPDHDAHALFHMEHITILAKRVRITHCREARSPGDESCYRLVGKLSHQATRAAAGWEASSGWAIRPALGRTGSLDQIMTKRRKRDNRVSKETLLQIAKDRGRTRGVRNGSDKNKRATYRLLAEPKAIYKKAT